MRVFPIAPKEKVVVWIEKTGKRIGEGFGDEVFPLPSKDMVMRFLHIPQICGSLDRDLEKDLVMRFFLFPPRIW